MEPHPIPQHIASYEFRLVGDMTIRQFGLLASCCVVGLIFYASPLPGYIKWPIIGFCVFLGIALAFLPVEERPLHRWLLAFFKAIYSPTLFVWKKIPKKPVVPRVAPVRVGAPKLVTSALPGKPRLYVQVAPAEKTQLEKAEESFLERVTKLFQLIKIPAEPTPPPVKEVAIPTPTPVSPKPPTLKPPKIKVEPEKREPAVEAKISPGLPFPQTPQTPNLLVGMVLDQKGRIIQGAILEIRNSQGIPVRALKTNKLGQFRIVTPLENDTYEIETEKEGYKFDIIKVEAKGEPIPPIEIRTKGTAHRVISPSDLNAVGT